MYALPQILPKAGLLSSDGFQFSSDLKSEKKKKKVTSLFSLQFFCVFLCFCLFLGLGLGLGLWHMEVPKLGV